MEVTYNENVVGKYTEQPGVESQPGMENHRAMCLCWHCEKFNIAEREKNCPIANAVYALCVEHDLVAPVVRCGVCVLGAPTLAKG